MSGDHAVHSHLNRLLPILMACVCLGGGCSYGPVNTPAFSRDSGVGRIDPNDGPFVMELAQELHSNTGRIETFRRIEWQPIRIMPDSRKGPTSSVKCRALDLWLFSKVRVPVRMSSGREYSAVMDTGYAGYVYVNDAVVRDNDWAVYPLFKNTRTGCAQGLCEIPAMNIGDITIENLRGWYVQRQWQLRVLGVPLHRRRTVLIGLDLMRPFPYVLFDNSRGEVVFSPHDAFEPSDPSEWINLPFTLEEVRGDLRMMVAISMAGAVTRVQFDTGGGKAGLILSQESWQNVEDRLAARGGGKGKIPTYQYGWVPCRRFVVPELQVGDLTLHDKEVIVLPSDSPLGLKCSGILGLDYFKKTSVVLDFKTNRIWIRTF